MCLEEIVREDLDLHLARLAASQANNSRGVGRGEKKTSFLLPLPAREQRNMQIWPR